MTSISAQTSLTTDDYSQSGWILLTCGMIASSAMLLFAGDDIGLKVAAMFVLSAASSAAVRFDIAHPFVWFAGAFTLYSVSGPLLFHMGVHPYQTWGGYRIDTLNFSAAMDYQFFALLIALAVIGPKQVSLSNAVGRQLSDALFRASLPVLIAACVIGFANIALIVSQDFNSKGDVVLTGDWTTRLSFAFNIAATALGVYLARLFSEGRPHAAYLTLTIMVLVGVAMVLLIGLGFTIAGYGYLHFGELGVLTIMLLVGGTLRKIYRWASRSATGLMFYIGFFPIAVYIARNDITGPLSQGLKHVLLPLVAMTRIAHFLGNAAPRRLSN